MHILAHYFHTARITCGCMWKSLNMTAKNLQSNPVWPYIPHEMHMFAHYFHTTRSTCGCMWKNVNMNSQKTHSQIPCGITFHIKCTCSHIISTQQNQQKCEYKQQKIHSQIPCGITFYMKCTYLHIIFTQQELRLDACRKININININSKKSTVK